MSSSLKILKFVTTSVVSIGAGAVVSNAIKVTTPEELKLLKKVSIAVGGFVISSMVADAASKYTEKQIDEGAEAIKNIKDEVHIITDVEN